MKLLSSEHAVPPHLSDRPAVFFDSNNTLVSWFGSIEVKPRSEDTPRWLRDISAAGAALFIVQEDQFSQGSTTPALQRHEVAECRRRVITRLGQAGIDPGLFIDVVPAIVPYGSLSDCQIVSDAKAGQFKYLIGKYQLKPHNVIVVGDNPKLDGEAARKAGQSLNLPQGLAYAEFEPHIVNVQHMLSHAGEYADELGRLRGRLVFSDSPINGFISEVLRREKPLAHSPKIRV